MDAFSLLVACLQQSYERIGAPAHVLTTLSGGADSVALFRGLLSLRAVKHFTLSAVHVNHGLRENAALDAAFCAELCKQHEIPLTTAHVSVNRHGSLEAAARKARYEAFAAALQDSGANVLALAHHMDDQAETMLLHLLHGAGTQGLLGMSEFAPPVWRPLLSMRRSALQMALISLGQSWREDETNGDLRFTRNVVRAQVMPVLNTLEPKTTVLLCRTGEILREEDALLEQMTQAFLQTNAGTGRHAFILRRPLAEQPIALQRRIIRAYGMQFGIEMSFSHIERVREMLDAVNGTKTNLPQNWHALKTDFRLHYIPPEALPNCECTKDAFQVQVCGGDDFGDGRRSQAIHPSFFRQCRLRTRREGDSIQPFGMQGHQKLKDYLIARGIDQPFRDDWPLLCSGSEVLWVIGVGASEKLRIVSESDDLRLYRYAGQLPDDIIGGNKNGEC